MILSALLKKDGRELRGPRYKTAFRFLADNILSHSSICDILRESIQLRHNT